MKKTRGGFTLLEMLIATAIFSGLVILILGTFARTGSSSAKVSILRNKAESARSIMSQIREDFNYLYTEQVVTFVIGNSAHTIQGYTFSAPDASEVIMILKSPEIGSDKFTIKRYSAPLIAGVSGSQSRELKVLEARDCRVVTGGPYPGPTVKLEDCAYFPGSGSVESKMLPDKYVLDNQPVFTGLVPLSTITGFVKIRLSLKPSEFSHKKCEDLPAGTCYTLETTLNGEAL